MGNNWAGNPREIKDLLSPIIPQSLKKSLKLVLSITLHTLGPQSSQNYPFGLIEDFFGIFHQRDFYLLIKTYHAEKFEKNIGVYTKT